MLPKKNHVMSPYSLSPFNPIVWKSQGPKLVWKDVIYTLLQLESSHFHLCTEDFCSAKDVNNIFSNQLRISDHDRMFYLFIFFGGGGVTAPLSPHIHEDKIWRIECWIVFSILCNHSFICNLYINLCTFHVISLYQMLFCGLTTFAKLSWECVFSINICICVIYYIQIK